MEKTTTPAGSATGTDLDLDKLEELARAATPGPWAEATRGPNNMPVIGARGLMLAHITTGEGFQEQADANGAHIAAANPATMLALIPAARRASQPSADRAAYLERLVAAYGPKSLQYDIEHPNDGLNSSDPKEVERTMRGADRAPHCGSYECRAGQRDGITCADGECDIASGVRQDRADRAPDHGALSVPRVLLARCLTSMRQAVSWEKTREGRPPSQTCMFEIEDLDALLRAPTAAPADGAGGTSEQQARYAIDGAIQHGRENRNQPPSTDHWLYEYWNIGRQLAKLGETSAWDNVTPLAAPAAGDSTTPQRWQQAGRYPEDLQPHTRVERYMHEEILGWRALATPQPGVAEQANAGNKPRITTSTSPYDPNSAVGEGF